MSEVMQEYVGNDAGALNVKQRWWLQDDKDIYKHVWRIVNSIEDNQQFLRAAYARFAAMYSNMEFLGLSSKMFSRTALNSFFNNRLSLNVIKSCIDSAASKIAKNKPRPLFLTSDGNWSQQRRAKQLTKFMDGIFEEMNIYEMGQRAFVDAAVFGIGILKPYYQDGKFKVDRVFPEELTVDEADAIYGDPQQIHQTKYISRDVLCEMYPEYSGQIMSAMSFVRADMAYRSAADRIAVRESWHLKSGINAKDGKHTIIIENCTLLAEEYTKDYFPFVFYRWNPRVFGFYGMGLAEELVGIQLEISKILTNIQRSIHLVGVPRVWVENSSQVNISAIINEPGTVGKYTGTPPVFQTQPSMAPDVYAHLENLFSKAYQITGISLLSATSTKPAGVNAAVAMREYQDIESERFMLVAQRYEKSFMDLAKIVMDIAKDVYANGEGENIKTNVKTKNFVETIKWSDVNMDADKFIMRVFPTSLLPSQPQGRLAQIQELTQAGFISQDDARSLMDFPDLEGVMSLYNAARDDIMMLIEDMIENNKYQSPEPFMNIQMAALLVQSAYLKAKQQSVPEERLDLLRRFMDECQEMLAPPMPMAMPVGVPTAAPMPTPTNELIPNVPGAAVPV